MPTDPLLNVTHIETNQFQKEVTHNEGVDDLAGKIAGYISIDMADANVNLETTQDADGDPIAYRNKSFEFYGTNAAQRTVTLPDRASVYIVWNNTTGGFSILFDTAGGTAQVTLDNGKWAIIIVEATDFDVRAVAVALNLSDILDVDVTGLANGDYLSYNSSSGKWEVGPLSFVLPTGYISGFGLANNGADAAHDIDIASGAARDDSDTYDAILSSTLVKQIDAAFAEGTNQGGMATGTVAADTWYHVNIIRKDADGTIDACFDTSASGANTPAGWTFMRRIGAVLTDSTPNILGFTHIVESATFLWDDPILDINISNQGATAVARTLSVPPSVISKALMNVYLEHASTQTLLYLKYPGVNDEAPSVSVGPLATMVTGINGTPQLLQLECYADSSAQISSRADNANTILKIATLGWQESFTTGGGASPLGGDSVTLDYQEFSAQTTVDLLTGFDSALYAFYTIEFQITATTDQTQLWGNWYSSGPTLLNGVNTYSYNLRTMRTNSTSPITANGSNNQTAFVLTWGSTDGISNAAGRICKAELTTNDLSAGTYHTIRADIEYHRANSNQDVMHHEMVGGYIGDTNEKIGFQLNAGGTNTISGWIKLVGHKRS